LFPSRTSKGVDEWVPWFYIRSMLWRNYSICGPAQLAVWMALYMKADGDDEWQAATARILELAATEEKPATL